MLFNDILLGLAIEDPMVNLLINKKNENIEWDWEKNHLAICKKYFNLVKKTQLSKTRFVVELSKNELKKIPEIWKYYFYIGFVLVNIHYLRYLNFFITKTNLIFFI